MQFLSFLFRALNFAVQTEVKWRTIPFCIQKYAMENSREKRMLHSRSLKILKEIGQYLLNAAGATWNTLCGLYYFFTFVLLEYKLMLSKQTLFKYR